MKEVLYFSATWCIPCRQMKPIVEKLEADTGIKFTKVDADSEVELSGKYQIRSIPAFILVEDGVEISRAAGAQTGKELAAALSL